MIEPEEVDTEEAPEVITQHIDEISEVLELPE